MSRAWLRGVVPQHQANTNINNWSVTGREHCLIIYYFLTKCLGYSHEDEVSGTGDWLNNHQATDTDGAFAGTDYVFTISSSKFNSGMVDEFICIVDGTNEENTGLYRVLSYTDANNIVIDFYTTAGTYPTAATGLTWYMLDYAAAPAVDSAAGTDGFVVLESPHATSPSTIKLQMQSYDRPSSGDFAGGSQKPGWGIEVVAGTATDNWDSGGHTWTALGETRRLGQQYGVSRGEVGWAHNRIYAYGDTGGEHLTLYSDHNGGASNKQCAFTMGVITPLETSPVHDPKDLVVAFGPWEGFSASNTLNRNHGTDAVDRGACLRGEIPYTCSLMDWHGGAGNRLFATSVSGPSEYTGEYDGLPIHIFADSDNSKMSFAMHGQFSPAHIVFTTALHLGNFKTFDSDTWLHLTHGLAIPWPGLPVYY